jgi:hypothetical protein
MSKSSSKTGWAGSFQGICSHGIPGSGSGSGKDNVSGSPDTMWRMQFVSFALLAGIRMVSMLVRGPFSLNSLQAAEHRLEADQPAPSYVRRSPVDLSFTFVGTCRSTRFGLGRGDHLAIRTRPTPACPAER